MFLIGFVQVAYLVFLALFSYVLLRKFTPESILVDPFAYVLCGWILSLLMEEVRQVLVFLHEFMI